MCMSQTYVPTHVPIVSRNDLVSITAAAGFVGVDVRAIRKALRRGELIAYRDPADKRRRLVDKAVVSKLFSPVPESGDAHE